MSDFRESRAGDLSPALVRKVEQNELDCSGEILGRAGDPKNGPAAGAAYLLCRRAKVKIWARRISPSPGPDTPDFKGLGDCGRSKSLPRRYATLVMLSNWKA